MPSPDKVRKTPPSRSTTGKHRRNTILLVSGLLLTTFIAFISHEWGATWHSILGIGAFGVVAWHVCTQRRWVRSAAARRMAHPERKLVIFNPLLALTFGAVMISGIPVWLAGAGGVVERVHTISGMAFLPLVIIHLILNRHRVAAGLSRRRAAI